MTINFPGKKGDTKVVGSDLQNLKKSGTQYEPKTGAKKPGTKSATNPTIFTETERKRRGGPGPTRSWGPGSRDPA